MAETPQNNTIPADDICKDEEIRAIRQKTFSKLKWGPILNSASRMMGMFGGPLLGTGLLGWMGFGGVAPGLIPTAITMAIVGATLSVLSIAADYIGIRIQQDGYLDQTEVGARSNAKYLVQALQANNLCLTQDEHEQNCRADGRSWVQVTRPGHPEPTRTQQG